MKTITKIIIAVVAFILLLIFIIPLISNNRGPIEPNLSEEEKTIAPKESRLDNNPICNFKNCNDDSDCIKVDSDCCGCNSGGTAEVINRDCINSYDLGCESADVACIEVISTDPSCSQTPACQDNKCVLK